MTDTLARFREAFDAIEELWPDAPMLAPPLKFYATDTGTYLDSGLRIDGELCLDTYAAEAVCIRHAAEIGAWWHRRHRSTNYLSVEPVDSGVWFWRVGPDRDMPAHDHGEAKDQAHAYLAALNAIVKRERER